MPVHDWTRVDARIFHHFRLCWLGELMGALNRGLLPSGYYVLATRDSTGLGLDEPARSEPEGYAMRASFAAIRHTSDHQVRAILEVVSPDNKESRHGLRSFVERAAGHLRAGIHLVVLDLFGPGRHEPQGIHKVIWDEFNDDDFAPPPAKPLTLASYIGGPVYTAFIEPTSVGADLPDMALFLTPEIYVRIPLEATYRSAWDDVPAYWRDVLATPAAPGGAPNPRGL